MLNVLIFWYVSPNFIAFPNTRHQYILCISRYLRQLTIYIDLCDSNFTRFLFEAIHDF